MAASAVGVDMVEKGGEASTSSQHVAPTAGEVLTTIAGTISGPGHLAPKAPDADPARAATPLAQAAILSARRQTVSMSPTAGVSVELPKGLEIVPSCTVVLAGNEEARTGRALVLRKSCSPP